MRDRSKYHKARKVREELQYKKAELGMSCQQLRPVLIVLELAPLTPRNNRKDDNSTREI